MNPKDVAVKVGRDVWRRLARLGLPAVAAKPSSAFLLSDTQFLEEFDLPRVSEQVKRGNTPVAKQILLQHYRHRRVPGWPCFPRRFTNAAELSEEALERQAGYILDHRFGEKRIWLGDQIDWHHNPTSDPRARWTREVHRHRWMALLAAAYRKSGDERYAQEFVELVLDWIRSNPMPARKNEADVAWTLMGVGMRGLIWPAAFASFYRSPAFNDEAKFTMLRSIYDHAQFLSAFKTNLNHVLRESNGLACLGVYFPEFKRAPDWRQTALARLEQELVEHVNPDGSSVEMSTAYQWLVTDEFDGTEQLLKEHDLRLPKVDLDVWLVKLYAALAFVLRPDGVWPRLDDGFMEDDAIQRAKLAAAGERLDRPDFIYIATLGARGEAPEQTSTAFREAGLYVMRSDWTRDARYLLLDAGPFGGPHGHEDKLSIEVFAYGKPFVVDPGCYTYNTNDPYRAYFASSRAHSTAMVAGKSQVRRWNARLLRPKAGLREPTRWISSAHFDYAEGVYSDGYASFAWKRPRRAAIVNGVSHTRRVLFVKPDYWLVVDELASASESHDYEILFNLSPDIRIEPISDGGLLLHAESSPARLCLITAGSHPCEITSVCGSTEAPQGWYANGWHEHKVPTATVICRIENAQSTVLATLLYPCLGELPVANFQTLAVVGGDGLAYRVTSSLGTDYLLFSPDKTAKTFGPCVSQALIAGFRVRDGEEPTQLFSWH